MLVRRCITTGALLVAATACAPASPHLTDTHAAAIRDSVQQTLAQIQRYSAAGLRDSTARFYADTSVFRWVEDGRVQYRSVTEIREALAALGSTVRFETTFEDTDVLPLAPGVASVVTRFETRFVDSLAAAFTFGGMITMTLIHRPDGWRILTGHASSAAGGRS
ncbi:MAG: hypothetical protein OER21_13070 [Gemmatimonadota bacterium]|nr:hypothetical protein [Gemmatimonadota bacterium]